jgi:hypothetical protein
MWTWTRKSKKPIQFLFEDINFHDIIYYNLLHVNKIGIQTNPFTS